MTLHFNMPVMEYLADHRTPWLTDFFLAATYAGEISGYILIVMLIYTAFDKTLGVRLAVLVLFSMSLNHILKIIIKNPRPFIREGDYMQKWAVSADNARELATEYSTPSGHAMAVGAFYSYLYAKARNRWIRIVAVAAILIIGASRPYLGVHYVEDVVSGWLIGIALGLIAIGYAEDVAAFWSRLPYVWQIVIAVAASLVLWALTVAINGWEIDAQPRAFLGYVGFLTGIVIGQPLELAHVDFDARSGGWVARIARYILSVVIIIAALALLDNAFARIAPKFSLPGYALQYLRYTLGGVIAIYAAPLLFTRLGLAKTHR